MGVLQSRPQTATFTREEPADGITLEFSDAFLNDLSKPKQYTNIQEKQNYNIDELLEIAREQGYQEGKNQAEFSFSKELERMKEEFQSEQLADIEDVTKQVALKENQIFQYSAEILGQYKNSLSKDYCNYLRDSVERCLRSNPKRILNCHQAVEDFYKCVQFNKQ
ncbi:uncharacterized protein LOC135145813 [Zophobas morio]|uniref:uncharacterized protein LOC135145813 n=1 Tax=Zophobas morio TaxID=2755281 RepID=UPI003083CC62